MESLRDDGRPTPNPLPLARTTRSSSSSSSSSSSFSSATVPDAQASSSNASSSNTNNSVSTSKKHQHERKRMKRTPLSQSSTTSTSSSSQPPDAENNDMVLQPGTGQQHGLESSLQQATNVTTTSSASRASTTNNTISSVVVAVVFPSREYSLTEVNFAKLNQATTLSRILCSICQSVTIEPTMVSACQHTYCKSCILAYCRSLSSKAEACCPNCRTEFEEEQHLVKNLLQSQIIDSLRVPCLHPACTWTGEYSQFQAHLKNCDKLLVCVCKKIVDRREQQHSAGPTADKQDDSSHINTCAFVKIACTACGRLVERGAMGKHVTEMCDEQLVGCTYEQHGCVWRDKRRLYFTTHESECKVRRLCKKIQSLERRLEDEKPLLWTLCKGSDSFYMTGLVGDATRRRSLILQHYKSFADLKFPFRFGSLNPSSVDSDQVVKITSVEMSGILDVNTNLTLNNCVIDIDDKQGIMAITFAGNRDRFFIFPVKSSKPSVEKAKNGRIQVQLFDKADKLQRMINPAVYAHREWIGYKDTEYPFVIEPTSRFLFRFNLWYKGSKVLNDSLHAKLVEFFSLTFWHEVE